MGTRSSKLSRAKKLLICTVVKKLETVRKSNEDHEVKQRLVYKYERYINDVIAGKHNESANMQKALARIDQIDARRKTVNRGRRVSEID